MPSSHSVSGPLRRGWPLAIATVLTCAAGAQSTAQLAGDAGRGGERFVEFKCYACHGYNGETGTAPRLNPTRFNQVGFIAYLRSPSTNYKDQGMGSVMPPYAGDDVSDQDLADIFAYLQARPSSAPPLESLPLLTGD